MSQLLPRCTNISQHCQLFTISEVNMLCKYDYDLLRGTNLSVSWYYQMHFSNWLSNNIRIKVLIFLLIIHRSDTFVCLLFKALQQGFLTWGSRGIFWGGDGGIWKLWRRIKMNFISSMAPINNNLSHINKWESFHKVFLSYSCWHHCTIYNK